MSQKNTSVGQEDSTTASEDVVSFVKSLLLILIVVLGIRGTIIEPFKIPSGSMIPTLQIGDYLFVWKLSYGIRLPFLTKTLYQFKSPERGDIVVFTRPDDPATQNEDESENNIIKRVIGLPGDKVEVRGTQVFINDAPLLESYARWEDGGIRDGDFGPATVPQGHLFVMGDNRDRSKDSRFWGEGSKHYLPIENVKGRAFLIFFSWAGLDRIGTILR